MNTKEISRSQTGEVSLGNQLFVHRLGYGAMRLTGEGILDFLFAMLEFSKKFENMPHGCDLLCSAYNAVGTLLIMPRLITDRIKALRQEITEITEKNRSYLRGPKYGSAIADNERQFQRL